jgi:RHS repeat-associated protein
MTGNLTSANNRMSDGETWNFAYDNLDRLTAVQENNEEIMEMVYAANGNITYKTDMGCYDYSSSSKPHAVQSIDNDEQTLTLYGHEITYNLWGKVSTIWHYDQTDFYYYTAEYGPDLEKVSSRYDKTYHIEYEKFQWGDYEEKTTDGVTTSFYFVNGGDGLAGLHTVSSTQGGTVTHSAAAITDHLGTITAMVDNNDWCYDVHYDVWGNRVISMPFYYSIERGFTGHDHIDGIGLIDMRGRMYDPHLGRFLSPDAFVQAPTNPQNYNRYSYCLNNPLKYTDPTGEIFGIDDAIFGIAISAIVGGISGYMVGSEANASGWDMVGYIAGGVALGAFSSGMSQGMAALGASPFVTQLTTNAMTSTLSSGMMSGWDGRSMLMGLASGLVSGGISGALSFSYDPVGMINGMLADGAVNAAVGAVSGEFTSLVFGGNFGEGALNGAISGALSGMAYGAYRGMANAKTLGVNKWTGGTLQERAQAWANYYGLPGEMFNYASKTNLDNLCYGKEYKYVKQYDGIAKISRTTGEILKYKIDGLTSENGGKYTIYLRAKTIRHARFNTGWGKGTFFHEYYHTSPLNYSDEVGAYKTGYYYGGRRYYRHCLEEMLNYQIPH